MKVQSLDRMISTYKNRRKAAHVRLVEMSWNYVESVGTSWNESAKLCALRALMLHVPRVLRVLGRYVPRDLRALVPHVHPTRSPLVPHVFSSPMCLTCSCA